MKRLRSQKLEHREQRMALEELLEGVRQESERVERLQHRIREAVPEWSLAELVTALQAMRGFDLTAAVTVLAETGDLSRFQKSARAYALSGPCALRKLHRGQDQARRYRQGRQRLRTTHPSGGGLELSVSAAREQGQAAENGGCTETGAGDRVERANEAMRTLPVTCPQRQAAEDRCHGSCPRAIGIHLADQSRDMENRPA